ncbi:MAG: Na+/H+ antiporter subunit E [Brachybacterium sp.]|nr:Na+/H+ antiporter subunit E [Brachybacterium sp.]
MIISLLTLPVRVVVFACWFIKEILVSSFAVIRDALSVRALSTPRVVRMDLGPAGGLHVTMISALITLTPGTLTLGVVGDGTGRSEILVHTMYDETNEAALESLHDMDDRMMRSVRIGGR